jgi:CheY-like chemotaxis protein
MLPEATEGLSALRVLVVDDNRDAANTLSLLLELWGYEARVAYDGANALETAAVFRPHCLFLDVAMPHMDGCTLARRLRQQPDLHEAKLIALTAFADAEHSRRICEAGFDYHLVKPADPDAIARLLTMLNEVLQLTTQTQRLTEQSAELARETKNLIGAAREELQEVKQEIREVKGEIREVKGEIREVKEELREVREALGKDSPEGVDQPE